MANKQREFSRATLKEARRLYEETNATQKSIAAMLGISAATFRSRLLLWGWTKRRGDPPPPAAPAPELNQAPAPDAPQSWQGQPCTGLAACPERSALVAKLWASVARQVARIDAAHGQFVSRGAPNAGEAEGYAKLIAMLARSLRELAALDAAMQDRQGHTADAASAGTDADALRDELAQRLAALEAGAPATNAGQPDVAGN